MRLSNLSKHFLSLLAASFFLFIAFGSNDDQKTETDISTINSTHTVSAKELYADYEANGVAADQKYKDQVITVTGVVDKIDKDIMDKIYVTLKGGEYIGDIQCFFADSHVNEAANLNQGQKITVKGKCTGKLMNVMLEGCSIQ